VSCILLNVVNDHPLSGNPRPAEPGPKAQISEYQKAGEFLAAERTFLVWIRTGISIISLGFVIANFGLWLRELAARLDPKIDVHGTGMSLPIGIGMMG
jgi:putative membrane protein